MTLSLRQKLGQLFIVGFHGQTVDDPWVQDLSLDIKKGEVGGIILFSYNIKRPFALKKLTRFFLDLQAPLVPFISVDQEGGRVQRLSPQLGFKGFISAETVSSLTFEGADTVYQDLAEELRHYHINLNFSPSIDLNDPSSPCPVIGALGRSYGSNPEQVASYGRIVLEAFEKKGVLGCLKHFPGHGSAQADSHAGFVDVTQYWAEKELKPFFNLVDQKKAEMIMTAHIFNEHLDPEVPATFSRQTLDLLRQKGYDGVIISDDLHMGAIQAHYSVEEASLKALNAGCDMIILSNNKAAAVGMDTFTPSSKNLPKLLDFLEQAVLSGSITQDRVDEAFYRVQILKEKLV